MRENLANFATGTLNSTMNAGSTSFTLQTGQGVIFPVGNFVVVIDTEAIQISSVSGDSFTVGGRGYDGSQIAPHAIGATVQLPLVRYNLYHIWQNVADTYNPQVPPAQIPGHAAANASDTEFETLGSSWSLYPSASSGSTFSIGSDLASHLLLSRAQGDNTFYTAYTAFSQTGAFSLTCKVSSATSFLGTAGDQAQVQVFVCDQSNPTAGSDTGNRFRVTLFETLTTTSGVATNTRLVRAGYAQSGVNTFLTPTLALPTAVPLYVRLTYNGAGFWSAYIGDGVVYTLVATKSGLSFTPGSLGISFNSYNPSRNFVPQVAAVDYVRIASTSLPAYGG